MAVAAGYQYAVWEDSVRRYLQQGLSTLLSINIRIGVNTRFDPDDGQSLYVLFDPIKFDAQSGKVVFNGDLVVLTRNDEDGAERRRVVTAAQAILPTDSDWIAFDLYDYSQTPEVEVGSAQIQLAAPVRIGPGMENDMLAAILPLVAKR